MQVIKNRQNRLIDKGVQIDPKRMANRAGLGAAVLATGLEANKAWGKHLDSPQKVSSDDVDHYIRQAQMKGIWKPRGGASAPAKKPIKLTSSADKTLAGLTAFVATGAGTAVGASYSSHKMSSSPGQKKLLKQGQASDRLLKDPKSTPIEVQRARYEGRKTFSKYYANQSKAQVRGAKAGGLGGLLVATALEANIQWGRHLDKPQKVSGQEVNNYIKEAERKGIYKPRKKRKDILE